MITGRALIAMIKKVSIHDDDGAMTTMLSYDDDTCLFLNFCYFGSVFFILLHSFLHKN